ncbi:MAG: Hsp20/alpha crystallin family protein [Spirochaetia bacterium]|jgi:HSP20 family protein|nr:Hsp20/alpha crystallin family protein [Spirochaetia bacterium]
MMANDFGSMMNDFFDFYSNTKAGKWPKVDVTEGESGYQLDVILPGYDNGDVDVKVEKHTLKLATSDAFNKKDNKEKKEERNYLVKESHGRSQFSRSFQLPGDADEAGIKANFADGILNVSIPKVPAAQPRDIKIEIETD